jgi:hypothetical protein
MKGRCKVIYIKKKREKKKKTEEMGENLGQAKVLYTTELTCFCGETVPCCLMVLVNGS